MFVLKAAKKTVLENFRLYSLEKQSTADWAVYGRNNFFLWYEKQQLILEGLEVTAQKNNSLYYQMKTIIAIFNPLEVVNLLRHEFCRLQDKDILFIPT